MSRANPISATPPAARKFRTTAHSWLDRGLMRRCLLALLIALTCGLSSLAMAQPSLGTAGLTRYLAPRTKLLRVKSGRNSLAFRFLPLRPACTGLCSLMNQPAHESTRLQRAEQRCTETQQTLLESSFSVDVTNLSEERRVALRISMRNVLSWLDSRFQHPPSDHPMSEELRRFAPSIAASMLVAY